MKNSTLQICNLSIQPGERITVALPTPELYTCAPIYIPIHVIHGKQAGPVLLVCGAMHGDEANGVAISQRLLKLRMLNSLKGTLIVIPAINIYGLITQTRNLPDRRDLEGSFPGSSAGSYASRLAYFLNTEIFSHITHCINLRTGEPHIMKLPQVKTLALDKESKEIASFFKAPIALDAGADQGLLWLAKKEPKVPTIIYETGEALRLDERGINLGVKGIIRVMREIKMLPSSKDSKSPEPVQVTSETWVRAPSSGFCEIFYRIGSFVKKGDIVAKITDPFGTDQQQEVIAASTGVIISKNHLPILNEGEPIIQIAEINDPEINSIENWTEAEKNELPKE